MLKNCRKSCLSCRREFTGERCPWCENDDSSLVPARLPEKPKGPMLHADVPFANDEDEPDYYGYLGGLLQSLSSPVPSGRVMSELLKRSRDLSA